MANNIISGRDIMRYRSRSHIVVCSQHLCCPSLPIWREPQLGNLEELNVGDIHRSQITGVRSKVCYDWPVMCDWPCRVPEYQLTASSCCCSQLSWNDIGTASNIGFEDVIRCVSRVVAVRLTKCNSLQAQCCIDVAGSGSIRAVHIRRDCTYGLKPGYLNASQPFTFVLSIADLGQTHSLLSTPSHLT